MEKSQIMPDTIYTIFLAIHKDEVNTCKVISNRLSQVHIGNTCGITRKLTLLRSLTLTVTSLNSPTTLYLHKIPSDSANFRKRGRH